MILQEQVDAIAQYYVNAIDAQREIVSEKSKSSSKRFLRWLVQRHSDYATVFREIIKNKTPDAVSKWDNDQIIAEWYIYNTSQLWGFDIHRADRPERVYIIQEQDLDDMPIVVLEKVDECSESQGGNGEKVK